MTAKPWTLESLDLNSWRGSLEQFEQTVATVEALAAKEAEVERLQNLLKDPDAVRVNILRGQIALPEGWGLIAPEVAKAREEQRASDADFAEAHFGAGEAADLRSAPLDSTPLQDRIRELEENNRKSFDLLVNTKASVAALREGLETIERSAAPGGVIVAKRSDEHSCVWCRGYLTPCPMSIATRLLASENPGKGFVGPETVAKVKEALDLGLAQIEGSENGEEFIIREADAAMRAALALLEGGKL